jgi:UDP-4-amino-4,6-dideoxy-N-acetyl-beta-L-altrosamine transaminase
MTLPIPYGKQHITEDDVNAVVAALRSDFLTQGPLVSSFEEAVTRLVNSRYGVAVNSATSALHIACLALDLSAGDWLWTTPITFVASANCALYCKAKIDFVDIDPFTANISVDALAAKLAEAAVQGQLPKILVAVHLSGLPCAMKEIRALSYRYGFKIIEDASHAIGGRYLDQPVGNCEFSDVTIFSFHPVKIITTAEGGMAVTNDQSVAERMALLRSHGITRKPDSMSKTPDGPWYYEQIALGFNYRMTDLQAALGISQLGRVDEYVASRHRIADIYDAHFAGEELLLPARLAESYSGFHLYVIRLAMPDFASRKLSVFNALSNKSIGVNLHYIPVHLQPYYQAMGFKHGDFPEAEKYYQQAITIPLFPQMTTDQIEYVASSVKEAIRSCD